MNMHRDAGRWRHVWGIHPSVLSKGEQRGRRCLFIIGLRAGKFLVWRRIFARISPNFHEKFFVQLLPANSLPRRSWKSCLVWPPKKVFVWFSANLRHQFLKSSKVGRHFYADFQGCCPDFQQIKTHWGCAFTPTSNKQHCFSQQYHR